MHEDRTRPYSNQTTGRVFLHQFKHGQGSGRLALFATIAGVLGLALGVISLALFLSYRGSATAQIHQMQRELAKTQSTLAKVQSGSANSLTGLASQVSGMNATLNGLAQFNSVCSQDLTGPNGPAQFFFACTDKKPG